MNVWYETEKKEETPGRRRNWNGSVGETVISLLLMGIGARWNGVVTGIDLQSQHGRKDRSMNNELITATEFGSNGNGISSECVDLSIELKIKLLKMQMDAKDL